MESASLKVRKSLKIGKIGKDRIKPEKIGKIELRFHSSSEDANSKLVDVVTVAEVDDEFVADLGAVVWS